MKGGARARVRYDPPMDRSRRATSGPYAAQLQNAAVEVFGLPKPLAKAHGTRCMCCGGNTPLLAIGVTGSDRRDIGFWSSEPSERRFKLGR